MRNISAATARRFHKIVAIVSVVVASAFVVTACGGGGGGESARPTTGAGIYRASCATCHGVEGQGGVGPTLAGRMIDAYPDIDDQIAVVTNGSGRMPAFRGNLSATEIRKVVEYTRDGLGE